MPVATIEGRLSHEQRITEQAAELAGFFESSASREPVLVQISGGPTAGKSALLREMKIQLQAADKKPIMVSPPAHELDAGPIAWLQLGAGLKSHGLLDGQYDEKARQESTWTNKLGAAREWLGNRDAMEDVVLLLDEPQSWPSRSGEDYHFSRPADDMAQLLFNQNRLARVIAGRLPDYLASVHSQRADLSGDRSRWLSDAGEWGTLADAAKQVAAYGRAVEGRTPLEIRLLVALQKIGEAPRLRRLTARPTSRRQISQELCKAMRARSDMESVRKVWAKAAMVRGELGAALLADLGLDDLDVHQRDLVRLCLLYSEGERWFMHETLRRDAWQHRWLQGPERQAAHRCLAEYYRSLFRQADGDLVAEAEAFHHAAETGDPDFAGEFQAFFVEQLDAQGKMLSMQDKFDAAVRVYERAVRWDPEDDYAHHYLAYNLDIRGQEAPRVEEHYKKALQIEPANAWWNSRWINYLITRNRLAPAKQAWDEAMDMLGLPDEDRDGWVYEHVHIWVARLLIHRGQLDFAREVLDSIPTGVRGRHLGMKALARRLDALLEARRTGAVFPMWIAPEDWWSRGPHLAAPRSDDDRHLYSWRPGRVEAIDEEGVHLLVATPPDQPAGKPTHGKLTLSRMDFDRFCRDLQSHELEAGRFLEIVRYQGRDEPIIRVHQNGSFRDDDLPPLFPDPARYLKADGWIS